MYPDAFDLEDTRVHGREPAGPLGESYTWGERVRPPLAAQQAFFPIAFQLVFL